MSRADLELALVWAREEGWNPGLDDAAAFFAQDAEGFLMGRLDGEPVGCVSVVKYDETFAFLGLYIVRSAFRGKGFGKAIWDAGIASANTRTIGLDGVVAQQGNYRRSGFVLAHRSSRWGGTANVPALPDPHVRPLVDDDLPFVRALDRAHFPAEREQFMSAWLAPAPSRQTLVYVEENRVIGFGTIRRAIDGWKVGPLFATTAAAGAALLCALAKVADRHPIFIDVPEPNESARAAAAALGLAPTFETARMYRGPAPDLALGGIFAVTTLELG